LPLGLAVEGVPSHQLMDGVHVKIVSERADHANISTTLSVYAAFIPNMQADAAAGVDKWLRHELAEQVGGKSVASRWQSWILTRMSKT
jgi:hypothetical protein